MKVENVVRLKSFHGRSIEYAHTVMRQDLYMMVVMNTEEGTLN